jgi:hypothetical protein
MPSRLLRVIAFAGFFAIPVSWAQQAFTNVLVHRPEGLYGVAIGCGADRELYFTSIGDEHFVLRASVDGASLMFGVPDGTQQAETVASYSAGVNILSARTKDRATREFSSVLYHFDKLGNLLSRHPVPTDLVGAIMATNSSGTTFLVGHHQDYSQYGGVVLDANDRIVKRFELPSPPAGGWTLGRFDRLLTTGEKGAYVLLHSKEPPITEIARISETGGLIITTIPEETFDDRRQHEKWLLGPGVAVDMYDLASEQPSSARQAPTLQFDEYDLNSGKKVASKTAPVRAECYYVNAVVGQDLLGDDIRLRIADLR